MAPKINWSKVEDNSANFEPLPINKYPCVLSVDNRQRDTQGNVMTNGDGQPAILHTKSGDEKWSIKATVLDGPHVGRWVTDNLSFGKAVKRAKIVLMRAGIIDENTTDYDASPEELDGTYWWVDVDKHEVRMNEDGTPKLRKDLKPILDPKVGFAGYTPLTAQEAKKYRESFAAWQARKADAEAPETAGEEDADKVPF